MTLSQVSLIETLRQNASLFVEPQTRVITTVGTEIPCGGTILVHIQESQRPMDHNEPFPTDSNDARRRGGVDEGVGRGEARRRLKIGFRLQQHLQRGSGPRN
jgi:hypothetical protein